MDPAPSFCAGIDMLRQRSRRGSVSPVVLDAKQALSQHRTQSRFKELREGTGASPMPLSRKLTTPLPSTATKNTLGCSAVASAARARGVVPTPRHCRHAGGCGASGPVHGDKTRALRVLFCRWRWSPRR
ncbi:MAG: hypothetical protein IT531_02430 [Burkholderiales bacterium]|nr:hypothetical protein [Burkholderiales bacterium]